MTPALRNPRQRGRNAAPTGDAKRERQGLLPPRKHAQQRRRMDVWPPSIEVQSGDPLSHGNPVGSDPLRCRRRTKEVVRGRKNRFPQTLQLGCSQGMVRDCLGWCDQVRVEDRCWAKNRVGRKRRPERLDRSACLQRISPEQGSNHRVPPADVLAIGEEIQLMLVDGSPLPRCHNALSNQPERQAGSNLTSSGCLWRTTTVPAILSCRPCLRRSTATQRIPSPKGNIATI